MKVGYGSIGRNQDFYIGKNGWGVGWGMDVNSYFIILIKL